MVVTIHAALLGALTSIVAAQTVDIFLPEYGRYQDSLVAESVGESAGVTTYLVGCGPQTVTSEYCRSEATGVARDDSPPLCTGSLPYNTYTQDSCVLTAGATLLEGPSTIVFIDAGNDGYSVHCSAAGTVSAVCTQTFTDLAFQTNEVFVDTITGSQYSFYHVPLTTGLTANGPLPTLQAGVQASTTSAAPSTSSSASPSPTPTESFTTSSTTTTLSAITTTVTSISTSTTSSSLISSSHGAISNTTTPTAHGSSNTTSVPPVATVTGSGATALTQWIMGAAAAAVVAVAATL
ncbi:hypothetical protein BP6252_04033 [Coleophoma cylindrospora]|uniref:Uncharacterized protein n=1 Tax=Coleophoma cylindrospora TaxID=1849047 RepID=A0A3D8RZD9_9HELO|nr:hypothetical protein BP6252_04033 [Coleophoma cylindrospora]